MRSFQRVCKYILCILLFIPCLGMVQGCGGTTGAPVIRLFTFTGQEATRRHIFYFKIEWEDAEGDLASPEKPARVVFQIQDLDDPQQRPVEFSFAYDQRLIEAGTRQGTIPDDKILPIQLSAEIRPDPGKSYPARMKISATLYDSQGNASNQPWVIIQSQGN